MKESIHEHQNIGDLPRVVPMKHLRVNPLASGVLIGVKETS